MFKRFWLKFKSRFIDYLAVAAMGLVITSLIFAKTVQSQQKIIKELTPKVDTLYQSKQDYTSLVLKTDSIHRHVAAIEEETRATMEATKENTEAIVRLEKRIEDEHKENISWFQKLLDKL